MTQENKTQEVYTALMGVLKEHDFVMKVSVTAKSRILVKLLRWLKVYPRIQLLPAPKENNNGEQTTN